MHLYSAFCVLLYTQSALQSCGGVGGGLSSTTTSVQHPLGWCDGCHRTTAPVRSPHTSHRWRGERVIETIKWMGIIRRPWLTRASGGNLARTPGLHLYSLREVPWEHQTARAPNVTDCCRVGNQKSIPVPQSECCSSDCGTGIDFWFPTLLQSVTFGALAVNRTASCRRTLQPELLLSVWLTNHAADVLLRRGTTRTNLK